MVARNRTIALLTACCVALPIPAHATAVVTAQLVGIFSDPGYIGNLLNSPTPGKFTVADNSATAPASTFVNGNTLQWGNNTGVFTPPATSYSSLIFNGANVPFSDQSTPILLGTITYLNGTSSANTLIFSASLNFSLNGIKLGSDQIGINTTINQTSGINLTQPQAQLDADYINICGLGSNICATGIQAYEDTEGINGVQFASPVVVDLFGTYTVDPGITLTSVTYNSGNGVVSTRPGFNTPAVPEPASWSMMLIGFGIAGLAVRRNQRVAANYA